MKGKRKPVFCGKCGGPVHAAKGEAADDYLCHGCGIYLCFACHLRRRLPTGPHTSAAHSIKPYRAAKSYRFKVSQ